MNKELFISNRSALELIDLGFDTSKCTESGLTNEEAKVMSKQFREK